METGNASVEKRELTNENFYFLVALCSCYSDLISLEVRNAREAIKDATYSEIKDCLREGVDLIENNLQYINKLSKFELQMALDILLLAKREEDKEIKIEKNLETQGISR